MKPERWQAIDRVFADVLVRPTDQRAAWLVKACGDDHDMRREVEELLAAEHSAERFLSVPVGDGALRQRMGPVPAFVPGRQIGPYRLARQIGQGGGLSRHPC